MSGIATLFESWLAHYGPQHWWPGETEFEVMTGAVLVQRTSWTNAVQAIVALKRRGLLASHRLAAADVEELEELVAPAGFFRIKARRLRHLARFVEREGGLGGLDRLETAALRARLLSLDGIGPETADAILLYAFERPVVVIDAYLRRILTRVRGTQDVPGDDEIRAEVLNAIDDAPRLNELHALAVQHGKSACRSRPGCDVCCIRNLCRSGVRDRAWRARP